MTRPGGLVVVAEPNNLSESLLLDSISALASIDEIVELVRFQLTCDVRDRAQRRFWNWSETDARRLFLAGGGAGEDFAAHFARGLAAREKIVRGLDDGAYHGIVGGAFYLVAGRKPRVRAAGGSRSTPARRS